MRLTTGRTTALALGAPLMLAVAAWSGVSAIGLMARTSDHHTATYAWQGGPIKLLLTNGAIQVVTGDSSRVAISYTEHYSFHKATFTEQATSDGGVQLVGTCPGGIYAATDSCSINVVLTVPASAPLEVDTGDGGIDVRDVTGSVVAHTGDGGVTLEHLSGTVSATTGDGGVTGFHLTSGSVTATTGDGGVDLAFDAAPTGVSVRTGDGGVEITVPRDTGPYHVETSSGDGGSQIDVPTDVSATATITAHTGDGGIDLTTSP